MLNPPKSPFVKGTLNQSITPINRWASSINPLQCGNSQREDVDVTAKPSTLNPAFEWLRSHNLESLNIAVEEYRHRKTGAVHYHLAADFDENVFLVALRTVPMDSTGVAHILEHTALCGSERFPVRDPFFLMLRRSLNTFMNAFTSSDWTAYPFASQNRKDFDNLLEVYLDAVFFSRLDPLDFAQEGHRIEFAKPNDPSSDLVYKGVVFNEMKGAMSSVPSTLWHTLCKYLYPSTTYHYNSGGDPEHIPDLSYADLKHFYQHHYHPTNAIFMTFGDIPAYVHQERFETLALSRFEKLDVHIGVPDEKRYHAPIRVQESYALGEDEDATDKTHIVLGWLFGKSANLNDLLKAQLLSSVLLDNSASPLQRALETTDLGSAPSPLCGLEDSMRELTFVCGLEGSNVEHVEQVEKLILDTIQDVADNGVPLERVEAVLHQLELHQREIGGDSYPYGLQLILNALSAATHRGDPIAMMDLEPVLQQLREDIKDPEFIKQLARDLLINNPHRVTLLLTPDRELATRRDAAEVQRLASIKDSLDDGARKNIIDLAQQLEARQQQKLDVSVLPKVTLDDVKSDIHVLESNAAQWGVLPTTTYARGTNGIVYQQLIIDLPPLDDSLLALLPYYSNALTEVGIGARDYLTTQEWQASVCGSINAYTSLRGAIDDEQTTQAVLVVSSKALARNHHAQAELMKATLENVRWDELPRLRDLIAQQRARREQSVTGNGHVLAMNAACAGMSSVAQLTHNLSGLAGIQAVKVLDDSLNQNDSLQAYADKLQQLHNAIVSSKKQLLVIAESEQLDAIRESISSLWTTTSLSSQNAVLKTPPLREPVRQLWQTNTQVNFCAKAYPTVPTDHPDTAALTVLGGFLRNGYLHRAIREQGGAYGGGASQDSNVAAFRFYSYRDPRLTETLADFDAAITWLLDTEHDPQQLEEAILGIMGSLDKPGSPAGEAKQDFHNNLFGRTPEQQRRFRARILAVTLDDLKRVATTYLKEEAASIALVTNESGKQQYQASTLTPLEVLTV
ncbi:MAG: peptidase [Verrucomicrobiaceae bacterium]|nr:peptidase [Verrucomicrobiaceae bacterium]